MIHQMNSLPQQVALRWLAFLFPAACLLPPVTRIFESSMVLHMLVQLPLLMICGLVIARFGGIKRLLNAIDPAGYASAVLASGWLIFWMLPINLDAAQNDIFFRLLKVLSLPLLGITAYWAWVRLGGVGRGVLVLEAWAMLMRTGWIFMISPEQICANYLPFEQHMTGQILLQTGALIAVFIIIYAFFRKEAAAP